MDEDKKDDTNVSDSTGSPAEGDSTEETSTPGEEATTDGANAPAESEEKATPVADGEEASTEEKPAE